MEGRSEGEILDHRWHFSGGREVGREGEMGGSQVGFQWMEGERVKWVDHRWDFSGWMDGEREKWVGHR